MKNILLILLSITLSYSVIGQDNNLILNVESLPDNKLSTETPLVLSLQYINETAMEAYIDQVFEEADKAKIEAMHQSGEISDSLYQIYKEEWAETSAVGPTSISNPSNISWEQENEDGSWSTIRFTMHQLNNTDEEGDGFSSDLIFYGIDASEVKSLVQVSRLRATSSGNKSNPIQLKLNEIQQQSQANTESELYYISNYWTLRQEHEQALSYADRLVSNYPNSLSGYFQKGVSQYHLGQYNEALNNLERALDLVDEAQFGNEPPDRILDYYYRVQREILQPQKN